MKLLILMTISLLSLNSYAVHKAQVVIMKGKVTKLEPGNNEASKVKKGDWLIEDTSLVTYEKSFIKVRFNDNSTMNVGPNSKVVINKMPAKKANMVNLLTGMIKAEVKKNSKKKSKTKMLVKTRSAIMGVRGTKFQSMYNHANKRTSLVTVEGKVAMVRKIKKDPSEIAAEEKAKEENVEKTDKTQKTKKTKAKKEVAKKDTPKIDKKPVKTKSGVDELEDLDELFDENSEEVVEVTEGQYSGVAESIEKPTQPVNIAPAQYNAIAKSMDSKKTAKEVMKPVKSQKEAEAKVDKKTGKIKPKAGGFIDFTTGLYVAPAADAKFDKKTGTFKAKKVGKVNASTGEYIPPKGIKVDAKKGFVVDKKVVATMANAEEKENLQRTLNSMKKSVKKQVTTVKQLEREQKAKPKSKPWVKDHKLYAQFRPYSETLVVNNKLSKSEADFFTEKAHWMIFTWEQKWNDNWSSRLRIGGGEYDIDETDVKVYDFGDNGDDGNDYFSIGVAYRYNKRVRLLFDLVDRTENYVVPVNGDGVEVRNDSVNMLDVGVEYDMLKWKTLDTKLIGTLHVVGSDTIPSVNGDEEADFFGLTFEAYGFYSWKPKYGIGTSLFYHRMDIDGDDIEFTRNALGIGLDFVYDI